MRFWYRPGAEGASGADFQRVLLLTPVNYDLLKVLLRTRLNSTVWREASFDLLAYRGKSVVIYFETYNDSTSAADRTWMFLDDVSVEVSPGSRSVTDQFLSSSIVSALKMERSVLSGAGVRAPAESKDAQRLNPSPPLRLRAVRLRRCCGPPLRVLRAFGCSTVAAKAMPTPLRAAACQVHERLPSAGNVRHRTKILEESLLTSVSFPRLMR